MILYNLFPLLVGPLPRWSEHFTRAAAMGFDWAFVNPIQQPGASRSLYSIADYFRINPALLDPQSAASSDDQVRQMTAAAKARRTMVAVRNGVEIGRHSGTQLMGYFALTKRLSSTLPK